MDWSLIHEKLLPFAWSRTVEERIRKLVFFFAKTFQDILSEEFLIWNCTVDIDCSCEWISEQVRWNSFFFNCVARSQGESEADRGRSQFLGKDRDYVHRSRSVRSCPTRWDLGFIFRNTQTRVNFRIKKNSFI